MERAQFKTGVLNKDVIFIIKRDMCIKWKWEQKSRLKKKLVVELKWTLYISSVLNTSRIHLTDTTQVSYVSTCCNFVFIYWKREMNEWKQNNLIQTLCMYTVFRTWLPYSWFVWCQFSILDRAYASILYRSDQIPPRPNVSPHEQSLPTPQAPNLLSNEVWK